MYRLCYKKKIQNHQSPQASLKFCDKFRHVLFVTDPILRISDAIFETSTQKRAQAFQDTRELGNNDNLGQVGNVTLMTQPNYRNDL